jgi:hypothetical protein
MDRFNVAANTMRVRLMGLASWLFVCEHGRTTFPMTLRADVGVHGEQSTQSDTYIVCLDCGRHFAYDWTTMHATKRRVAWAASPALLSALGDTSRGSP